MCCSFSKIFSNWAKSVHLNFSLMLSLLFRKFCMVHIFVNIKIFLYFFKFHLMGDNSVMPISTFFLAGLGTFFYWTFREGFTYFSKPSIFEISIELLGVNLDSEMKHNTRLTYLIKRVIHCFIISNRSVENYIFPL